MQLLENYDPKGSKNIPQIRVSRGVFEAFKNIWESYAYYTFSTALWNNVRKGLWRKSEVYLFNQSGAGEANKYRLIANANKLVGRILMHFRGYCHLTDSKQTEQGFRNILQIIGDAHKDFELILDSSLKDGVIIKCRPQDAKRELKAAIESSMSKEEFADLVKTTGLSEEDKIAQGVKPRHFDTNTHGKIIKFTDCIYQDIHKAHASYLLETFKAYPAVVNFVSKHLNLAKKAKKTGDIAEAKKHKDFINFAVGMLGQRYKDSDRFGHIKGNDVKWIYDISSRPLFNRCVQITRNRIDTQIAHLRKSIFETRELYSNTDGFILQHPDWTKVKHSETIGDFGIEETKNNEVWFYSVENSATQTGYSIHQYYDADGNKVVVGSLPDVLKEKVDLAKGIVVSYKTRVDELGYYNYDSVKQINAEMESR